MSSACVVRVEIPAEEFVLYDALQSLPGVEFEVERIVQSGQEAAMPLMWIRNADHDAVVSAFEDDPSVQELSLLSAFENEQIYRMEWISEVQVVLQMLTNAEATIMDAYGHDNRWYLRVLYPDRESLSTTTEFAQEQGLTVEITSIRQMEGEPVGRYGLTKPQFKALAAALEAGYYEVPREIEQSDLADQLGITHQALSERLRRATSALIEDTLVPGTTASIHDDTDS